MSGDAQPVYLIESAEVSDGIPKSAKTLCYTRGQFGAKQALKKITCYEVERRCKQDNVDEAVGKQPFYEVKNFPATKGTTEINEGRTTYVAKYAELGVSPSVIDVCKISYVNKGWVLNNMSLQVETVMRFSLRAVPIFDPYLYSFEEKPQSNPPPAPIFPTQEEKAPTAPAAGRNMPQSCVVSEAEPGRSVQRKPHEYEPIDYLLDELVLKVKERQERLRAPPKQNKDEAS